MTPLTATIRADLDSWRGFYMRMAARKNRESYQRVLAALNGLKGEK